MSLLAYYKTLACLLLACEIIIIPTVNLCKINHLQRQSQSLSMICYKTKHSISQN